MYELKLIYFATELNTIITHEQEFDNRFELRDWIKQNIEDFNFANQETVQYIIAKKEGKENG